MLPAEPCLAPRRTWQWLLHVLFPESSRSPGVDGWKLETVAHFIEATVLDVELAHYLCQRIIGVVGYTFWGFLTGWCYAAFGGLIYAARLWLGGGVTLFFSLLSLLKSREEKGSTTLQPCPWAKSVSSCRLMRVIRLPRLTAFSLPEAISNRTILVLTLMATEASFTDRRMLGI